MVLGAAATKVPDPSKLLYMEFAVILFVTVSLFVGGIKLAHAKAKETTQQAALAMFALVFLVVALGTSFLVYDNFFKDKKAVPPKFMRLMIPLSLSTILVASISDFAKTMAKRTPPAYLVGFHGIRILVEHFLHAAYKEEIVPVQVTFWVRDGGRNIDIATGVIAVLFALQLSGGSKPSWGGIAFFSFFGLYTLFQIVVVAAVSMPTVMRIYRDPPAFTLVYQLPFVWLPTMIVQMVLFMHIVAIRRWNMEGDSVKDEEEEPLQSDEA